MKKILLFLVFVSCSIASSLAQNNVQLIVNHKLGADDFALNQAVENNLGTPFQFNRFEYYIAELSITHDGGMVTQISDYWILVNAAFPTQEDLGDHMITNVEKVTFHIGVEDPTNHDDPAQYGNGHPLAPQNPSMHWGWTSGYRFDALEGKAGANLDQVFELHGLGDENYFQTEIPFSASAVDGVLTLAIDADYIRAMEDIEIATGVISHGFTGAAQKSLENFRDYVFSQGSAVTNTIDISEIERFEIFPNPTNGNANINIESSTKQKYQISVTDILGRQVQFFDHVASNVSLNLDFEKPGLYFVNLWKEGQPVITKKVISK